MLQGNFSSDLLAGISIITAIILDEYLAAAIVVLMLSGGQALETFASGRASAALDNFAKRLPQKVHKKLNDTIQEVPLEEVNVGDLIILNPHEVAAVDGEVVEGTGSMDESLLTGEPYHVSKTKGSAIVSGAMNGSSVMHVRVTRIGEDTRYHKIMNVMRESQQTRPQIRRLADTLGAWYTPFALFIAVLAGLLSGDSIRFLSVLVVATPCPLLIGIPISIIGSISVAARCGILVRDPAMLEVLPKVRSIFLDKTGTMTYGTPEISDIKLFGSKSEEDVLLLLASLEQFSSHPLAEPIHKEAMRRGLELVIPGSVEEIPGVGIKGIIGESEVMVSSRSYVLRKYPKVKLPDKESGLECLLLVNGELCGLIILKDTVRAGGEDFIRHLKTSHKIENVTLLSGDEEKEVRDLANQVGITSILARQSPEMKLEIVKNESAVRSVLFVGDGINDAPALSAATAGVAFGTVSDVSSEAAGAVIIEGSLRKLDELLHISKRMRRIALESAVGGMALSIIGMFAAASGYLSPVTGAVTQEIIDLIAVLNALRAAYPPADLSDY